MIIRVTEPVKSAIQAYAGQMRLKYRGAKRITENQVIIELLKRAAPDIWGQVKSSDTGDITPAPDEE